MTRDEHRAKCIEAMLDAYWHAFDWNMHSHKARDCLIAAFDSLHGIARVVPIEAVEIPMPKQFPGSWKGQGSAFFSRREFFEATSAAGDLTNPPEVKP